MVYLSDKRKIINDPVYGFINIPGNFVFDLVENPWFQRLRNIKQLGLTSFVYPGANHSRFQHGLGVLHLMDMAIQTLRQKGVIISDDEAEAALISILLHDAGHGPFSHALEHSIMQGITHEDLSLFIMNKLNEIYGGRLGLAIKVFTGSYNRKFLHELISGQIDMDRLDYLKRDSFFTGVIEGSVGSDRIIKMLNVSGDRLVIEENGIYSLEKFLVARRLMYWQVYMHKTVLSAEKLLVLILKRARDLTDSGVNLFATPALNFFLLNKISRDDLNDIGNISSQLILTNFINLDDNDIISSAKLWCDCDDFVLSDLCRRLINRELLAVELQNDPFPEKRVSSMARLAGNLLGIAPELIEYYVFTDCVSNLTYAPDAPEVKILLKSGEIKEISLVSDMFDHKSLSERKTKYFFCYPKECRTKK